MKLGIIFGAIGIAAVGGFAYAHRRRGGAMNIDSIKATALSLLGKERGTNSESMYEGDGALRH